MAFGSFISTCELLRKPGWYGFRAPTSFREHAKPLKISENFDRESQSSHDPVAASGSWAVIGFFPGPAMLSDLARLWEAKVMNGYFSSPRQRLVVR